MKIVRTSDRGGLASFEHPTVALPAQSPPAAPPGHAPPPDLATRSQPCCNGRRLQHQRPTARIPIANRTGPKQPAVHSPVRQQKHHCCRVDDGKMQSSRRPARESPILGVRPRPARTEADPPAPVSTSAAASRPFLQTSTQMPVRPASRQPTAIHPAPCGSRPAPWLPDSPEAAPSTVPRR